MRRAERKFYQIWNQVLAAVARNFAEVPEHLHLNDDQHRLLAVVINICEQMAYDEELSRWRSNAKLARKYGCSPRTICGWRAAQAPLNSQWRMLGWLADRHCLPRGTARKFAVQFARRKQAVADPVSRLSCRMEALQNVISH